MRCRFLIYLWWVLFFILISRVLGGASISCYAWKSNVVLTNEYGIKCHVKIRLSIQNEGKSVPIITKIQLSALVASGPEIGVSIYEAITATRLLRQSKYADRAYIGKFADEIRLALAKKDLQGFNEAWEFVRTHTRGSQAWDLNKSIK